MPAGLHGTAAGRTVAQLEQELEALRTTNALQARELEALQSRLSDLTETIDEVFWIADASISHMLYISPGYERVWGRSCASLYENPKSFIDAIHAEDRERVIEGLAVQRDGLPFEHEYRVVRPDSSVVWVWDRGYPVRNTTGTVDRYIGVAQDVTERKSAEAAARRQETLDAIGQMTGGLAHDFNNILSVIVGHLDLINHALPEGAPIRDSVDRALDAALRGERLAGRLLGLARQEPVERRLICLAAAIDELRPLLEYAAGASTRLDIRALARPTVRIDPGELDGALINLAVNARAAMPDGGDLRITVDDLRLAQAASATYPLPPGRYARIVVSDTGCGMDAETLRRIGEPFFTTRRAREGTGLGVSMVHAFVRRSAGAMRVTSQVGSGTQFELLLPVADASRV
ncbi:MAG: PAS domain-containing protein [Vicinamibacterales bacterium]